MTCLCHLLMFVKILWLYCGKCSSESNSLLTVFKCCKNSMQFHSISSCMVLIAPLVYCFLASTVTVFFLHFSMFQSVYLLFHCKSCRTVGEVRPKLNINLVSGKYIMESKKSFFPWER